MCKLLREFSNDIINLKFGDVQSKYSSKVLDQFSVDDVVDYILDSKLESRVFQNHSDFKHDGIYLEFDANNKYSVFSSERGLKFDLKIYDDLKIALQDYLNRYVDQLFVFDNLKKTSSSKKSILSLFKK